MYNYAEKSVCFIGNAHQSRDATINFKNTEYTIPAWSVSILPDCNAEAYNTAKVMRMIILFIMMLYRFHLGLKVQLLTCEEVN